MENVQIDKELKQKIDKYKIKGESYKDTQSKTIEKIKNTLRIIGFDGF